MQNIIDLKDNTENLIIFFKKYKFSYILTVTLLKRPASTNQLVLKEHFCEFFIEKYYLLLFSSILRYYYLLNNEEFDDVLINKRLIYYLFFLLIKLEQLIPLKLSNGKFINNENFIIIKDIRKKYFILLSSLYTLNEYIELFSDFHDFFFELKKDYIEKRSCESQLENWSEIMSLVTKNEINRFITWYSHYLKTLPYKKIK